MKKRAAFLLGLILLLALLLTACNNAVTSVSIRWNDKEEFIFDIELADFNTSENAKTFFNTYSDNNKTYYKDSLMSATEGSVFATSDQLRPVGAKGTFEMTIDKTAVSTERELTTKQTLYAQYKTEDLTKLNADILTVLKEAVASAAETEGMFDKTDGYTVFKSVTETGVKFVNDQTQKPISSYNKTNGYYIGKNHQGLSRYDISTVYDFDNRIAKVTWKKTDGTDDVKENSLGVRKGSYCLDANQMLLYVRSLGKTAQDFNDSPSKAVYDPYYNSLATANFALNREANVVLVNGGNNAYVTLNAVAVSVNGAPFIYQLNLPDLTAKNVDVGQAVSANEKPPKYTTVRFRVGSFSYELRDGDFKTEFITALTAKEEK